jgi:hypothetical protein
MYTSIQNDSNLIIPQGNLTKKSKTGYLDVVLALKRE